MKKQPKDSEHYQQSLLFQWAAAAKAEYPELEWLFAIPNGGLRNVVVAMQLKREGVKKGVPDIMLPVANGNYYGAFIEMKFGKNKMTPEQIAFKAHCEQHGYFFACCYSWVEARYALVQYIEGKN
jgi:hypothetical protein